MHHKAHVGFINPHAKRHGRHHNLQVITLKRLLHPSAFIGVHPRMVTGSTNVVSAQFFSEHFDFFPAATIDDAALPALRFQIADHLRNRLMFFHQHVANVRAIKTAQILMWLIELQTLHDVVTRRVIRSRRQRHHRDIGKTLLKLA